MEPKGNLNMTRIEQSTKLQSLPNTDDILPNELVG